MKILVFALYGNAVFSFVTGSLLITLSDQIAKLLGGVPEIILQVIGIALIPFAGHLVLAARRSSKKPLEILYLTTMDALWVLGSMVLLLTGGLGLSFQGKIIVIGVALLVGFWGTLQFVGRQQILQNISAKD